MKKMKLFTAGTLCALLLLSGCSSMNKTQKGALYGGGGGGALGAGIGAIAGGGKGAAIGAAIGTAVGAGTGALVGNRMDKQQKELEQEFADHDEIQVDKVTDQNDLPAIKLTFKEAILFDTGKSNLSAASMNALSKLAESLEQYPDTDVTVYGHTDNTGSRAVNEKLSKERADVVANYLVGHHVSRSRIDTEGLAYDDPIASNDTAAGRAQNRRVEIYLTASQDMISRAEAGTLE